MSILLHRDLFVQCNIERLAYEALLLKPVKEEEEEL
jgi:hypothetical protein